jgi:hypothetical protein
MKTSLVASLGFLTAVLFGCNSTGVGNPPRSETVSMAIVADDDSEGVPSETDGGAPGESLSRGSLDHAVLVLDSIRWRACTDATLITVSEGPFVVDLITGESRPPLPDVEIPEGGFCGFDAPLSTLARSADLSGRSLFFSGVRADGVPFLLFSEMRAVLRVRAVPGQRWDTDDDPLAVLWALRPRSWASRMELADARVSAWGERRAIVIDIDRNPALYALVRARLAGLSQLFVDQDADGFLDAEDRGATIGAGDPDTNE